jgi:putative flippase GtrA
MTTFTRWAKFNLVGGMGVAVQLAALALLNRLIPGHYLYVSAAAIELTLLHNFLWHVRFTWRDRADGTSLTTQLLRFNLSNGVVSLLGNLLLMRLLVPWAHMPVVVANAVAIVCCGTVNFVLGNLWAFSDVAAGSARAIPVEGSPG